MERKKRLGKKRTERNIEEGKEFLSPIKELCVTNLSSRKVLRADDDFEKGEKKVER